jgi:hypothetical protein
MKMRGSVLTVLQPNPANREGRSSRDVLMLVDNTHRLVRGLKEALSLKQSGYAVIIAAWDRDSSIDKEEHTQGITVVKMGIPTKSQRGFRQITYLLKFYLKIVRRFRRMSFSAIHACDLPMLLLGVALKLKMGSRLIYDAYEIYHLMESHKYNAIMLKGMATFEKILINLFVDSFITVSENRLEGYYKHILKDPSKAFVVGNYFDYSSCTSHCKEDIRSVFREKVGIPLNATVIGYIGSLNENRCLSLLLEWASKRPEVYLILAGRGSPRVELEINKYCTRFANILYMGWLDDPDPIYRSIDAIYYIIDPKHPYSQFAAPNTLYIAIAYGIPIIGLPLGELGLLKRYPVGIALDSLSIESLDIALHKLHEIKNHPNRNQIYKELRAAYSWQTAEKNLLLAYEHAIKNRKLNQ